jgi:hypothetical protein
VGPLACFFAFYYAGIAQNLHVMGQGGLADVQFVEQHTAALFPVFQKVQYLPSVFIAQRLKDTRIFLIIHSVPPIDFLRYIR